MDPKLTIATLVDYLLSETAGARYRVLQTAKSALGTKYFAPYYKPSRDAIRSFHSGNADILKETIDSLRREMRNAPTPQQRSRLENNIRALLDYQAKFTKIRLMHVGKRFQALPINGLQITSEPTLSGTLSERRLEMPCNVVINFHEEMPTQREVDYMVELVYRASGSTYKTAPGGAQLWHPRTGKRWKLKMPGARRWHEIEIACAEIASRWPTIP
jgi:hypothetical protein